MFTFSSLVILTLIGAANAYLASKRGRDPYLWFALGFLLGIFGILILLILPPVESAAKERKTPDRDGVIEVVPERVETMSMEGWFYLDGAKMQHGPITRDALLQLLSEGKVNAETYVWQEGMVDWKKIKEMPLESHLRSVYRPK